jgi:biofilm protein TabA
MIVGHMDNIAREMYSPVLLQGLKYLQQTDFNAWEGGRHEIDGDKMYAIWQEYRPDLKDNRPAETHGKYIDIQYVVAGAEIIGYSNLGAAAEIRENCLAEKDAVFYKNMPGETDILLAAGMYAIFFPWDMHRPGCVSEPGIMVRKVVVKIKI